MENIKADNWIEEVLESTNGMMHVDPRTDLLYKIQRKIQRRNEVTSMKTVWLVAASVVVLISMNIGVVSTKSVASNSKISENSILSTLNKSNQLY